MNKIKIPKNRLRKLKTFALGQKPYELQKLNSDKIKNKLIDLCSNDYFGLSRNDDVIKASYETSLSEGLGSGSSRFITGSRPIHKLLEKQLEEWLNKEKVLLFPSGFQANIAAVQGLANRNSIEYLSIAPVKLINYVEKTKVNNNNKTSNKDEVIIDPLLVEGSKKYLIDLTFKAEFINLLSFLRELEFQESVILINDISLKLLSENSNNGEINNPTEKIEVKLSTIFYGRV